MSKNAIAYHQVIPPLKGCHLSYGKSHYFHETGDVSPQIQALLKTVTTNVSVYLIGT